MTVSTFAFVASLGCLSFLVTSPALGQESELSGARRVGIRPGTAMNHAVGVTGVTGTRTYSATGLPTGLSINPTTGVITGNAPAAGTYNVQINVSGSGGTSASGYLQIESGAMLAATPPMGFNSWNSFEGSVSSQVIRDISDAIVVSGMRDAGYQYVNIDDRWSNGRDAQGRLRPDPIRFADTSAPGNGMEELADYVHDQGLLIGIYSDAGSATCAGFEGSFGHETTDAQTFADWGIDYVKHDYCNAPTDRATAEARYTQFGQALKNSGRSVIFSVTEWGQRQPWEWASNEDGAAAQLWRTTFDMRDEWDFPEKARDQHRLGVLDAADLQAGLEQYNGPGGWNDPDMMVVGVDLAGSSGHLGAGGLNYTQERTHFSLWAMWSSPLILNADLRKLDPSHAAYDPTWAANILPIITNHEVIEINQDVLGQQARRVFDQGDQEVWLKELANGDIAIALLNRDDASVTLSVDLESLGLSGEFEVRDLWAHQDRSNLLADVLLTENLDAYETVLLRLSSTVKGDITGDGFVGIEDLDFILANWGQTVLITSLRDGDISGDGVVGRDDLDVVLANWGSGVPPEFSIPEPASALLLGGMLLLCLHRGAR